MPCKEGFRLEVVIVLLRELDVRGPSGPPLWGLLCEPAVSRREERTEDRLSWREWPLASDRCFRPDTISRYVVCLPRRPCSKFVMTFRTSGRKRWRFSGRASSAKQVSRMFRRSSGMERSSLDRERVSMATEYELQEGGNRKEGH